jgi:hypothetical protein
MIAQVMGNRLKAEVKSVERGEQGAMRIWSWVIGNRLSVNRVRLSEK